MTDREYVLETIRRAKRALTLTEIHARRPEVSRDNVKEMVLYLVDLGQVRIDYCGAYLFPRTFRAV